MFDRKSLISLKALVVRRLTYTNHFQDFENIIDMLRNEKPMYLLWIGPNSENGVKTTAESVGEAEASKVANQLNKYPFLMYIIL
jgi:hypothetical protein